MLAAQEKSRFWSWVASEVTGRPAHLAALVEQRLCRARVLFIVAIPLWIASAIGQTVLMPLATYQFRAGAESIGVSPNVLFLGPMIVAILAMLLAFWISNGRMSIRSGRNAALIGFLGAMFCEGIHVGFSHYQPGQLLTFNLTILIVFVLAPFGWRQLAILGVLVLLLPHLALWFTGGFETLRMEMATQAVKVEGRTVPTEEELLAVTNGKIMRLLGALMINSAIYAVIGIVLNVRTQLTHKQTVLADLRLQRKNRLVAEQKNLLELRAEELQKQTRVAEHERHRAMGALQSVLTKPVALEYQSKGLVKPELKTVCVIACDAKGFSKTAERLQPERIVHELTRFFTKFDEACLRVHIEPLRAEGDARIAISGLWTDTTELHKATISAVLAMLNFRRVLPSEDGESRKSDERDGMHTDKVLWPARVGIHVGPVCTGVIDTSAGQVDEEGNRPGRLWYDVWGKTVNIACRLEQGADANQILVSESAMWETRGLFVYAPFEERMVKNTNISSCTSITGIHPDFCDANGLPNERFWQVFNDEHMPPREPEKEGNLQLLDRDRFRRNRSDQEVHWD